MNRALASAVPGLVLTSGPLAVPAPAADHPAPAANRRAGRPGTILDGVRVHLRRGTRQVVTVDHTGGVRARVTLHAWRGGRWHAVRTPGDGRTGYGGLVRGDRRRQGTGTTPLGTYGLPWTFGTHPRRPGWSLRHREIRRGDYWVQDNRARWYNRYRNLSQVRHRGAGILLHVNGRGATAGCASAPRWFLELLMARLDPDRTPVIAVGR